MVLKRCGDIGGLSAQGIARTGSRAVAGGEAGQFQPMTSRLEQTTASERQRHAPPSLGMALSLADDHFVGCKKKHWPCSAVKEP